MCWDLRTPQRSHEGNVMDVDSVTTPATPASKLRPPRVRHVELTREDLLSDPKILQAEVLAICAPAGYGKTTLAIQWASRADRSTIWLTLDEADNDPVVLMSSVLAGARHAGFDLPSPAESLTSSEPAFTRRVLTDFRQVIGRLAEPVTVVLDDVHVIDDAQCRRILSALVDELPIGSQLALVGRSLNGATLPLWRGQGRVVDITGPDLQFDTDLTRSALGQFTEMPVSDAVAEMVQTTTQGWPVAVFLMSERPAGISSAVAAPGPGAIDEFIETEILQPMPEEVRRFVCETAALGVVNADLAEYATGTVGAAHMLGTQITTVLIQRTVDGWYGYHPLMRECATGIMSRDAPDRLREIFSRAARWHQQNGHSDTAAQYALTSGDWPTMGEVIWPAARLSLLRGSTRTVQTWLARAGDIAVMRVPQLSLTAAWTGLATGDFGQTLRYARSTVEAMPDGWQDDLSTTDIAPHLALLLAVTGYGLDGAAEAADLAGRAWDTVHAEDPIQALAAVITGLNRALIGDPGAQSALKQASALARSTGIPSSEVESLALLGLVQMADGQDTAGCDSIQEATTSYAFHDLDEMISTTGVLRMAHVASTVFRGRVADTHTAIEALHQVRPALESAFPWFRPLCGGVLAFAAVRTGDTNGYREYATWCEDSRAPEAGLCRRLLARAEHEFAVASPLQQLSPAELRVWELLKSRMTLSEIADQLFLSRETVKSHTVSIYRKLGVASRRQAQDLAESWG